MNPIEYYNGVYICYSLGNFCFAGNSKPSDMSSFMFQTRWRIRDDEITNEGFRIIPIRISSRTDRNDFTPTVFGGADDTEEQRQVAGICGVGISAGVEVINEVACQHPADGRFLC